MCVLVCMLCSMYIDQMMRPLRLLCLYIALCLWFDGVKAVPPYILVLKL